MAGEVSAADGALKAGANVVAQTRGSLQQQLQVLDGKLSGIGSGWQGQGAVAFTQLMTRWRDDSTKIINALNEFEANLTSSQSTYTASDDDQAQKMSHLANRLG
jgi:WXG100 family type VII secretion target